MSNFYDIFDAGGVYRRSVRCTDIEQQLIPGETPVLNDGFPPTQKVLVDGVVTRLSTQPTLFHRTDPASLSWVDTRTFEQLKAFKWAQIKKARGFAEGGRFTHNGFVFDSDPLSIQRLSGAVLMALIAEQAHQPFSVDWTLADNTVHTFSGTEIIQIGLALGAHVSNVHSVARGLRQEINSAANPQEVAVIKWPD
jgi:hypothetical protein